MIPRGGRGGGGEQDAVVGNQIEHARSKVGDTGEELFH